MVKLIAFTKISSLIIVSGVVKLDEIQKMVKFYRLWI